jgi:hypothetical protein
VLHEGFNSGYQYRKMQVPGATRFADEPEKGSSPTSMMPCNTLLSAGGEDLEIRGRKDDKMVRNAQHVHDWDPFALQNS